ncbi:MAG: hypothetical protein M1836_004010 [Candelina mexicana]|nr:MAG: hypothetical protein M1836_004010 [Candelina mexicana]
MKQKGTPNPTFSKRAVGSSDSPIQSISTRNPVPQEYHSFQCQEWHPPPTPAYPDILSLPTHIRLITWNIDAAVKSGARLRMAVALNHLQELIANTHNDMPIVIFLQEMDPKDLQQIQDTDWIRESFHITDLDAGNWGTPFYGTTILTDKRLKIEKVFRVPYKSNMGHDGLFVDIAVKSRNTSSSRTLRFCNTHLESLVADPPLRPDQVALAAKHLRDPCVHAGILAGDFNAIQPFDCTLHTDNDLQDAFLDLGGKEDSEEGNTWGYQSMRDVQEKFGPKRMDKVCYCGGVDVERVERIGVGVMVEEGKRAKMRSWGALDWVTDHYGLMADLVVK